MRHQRIQQVKTEIVPRIIILAPGITQADQQRYRLHGLIFRSAPPCRNAFLRVRIPTCSVRISDASAIQSSFHVLHSGFFNMTKSNTKITSKSISLFRPAKTETAIKQAPTQATACDLFQTSQKQSNKKPEK